MRTGCAPPPNGDRRGKDTCYDLASMNWLLGAEELRSSPSVLRPSIKSTLKVSESDLTDLTRSSALGAKIPMPCLQEFDTTWRGHLALALSLRKTEEARAGHPRHEPRTPSSWLCVI